MHYKGYKFRIYPNDSQKELFGKHFGAKRFIYNHFLEQKIKHYKETKETIGWMKQAMDLPKLKTEHTWLKEIGSQTLQAAILNLDNAYTEFFRSNKKFPKFKSKKKSKNSFNVPSADHIKIDLIDNKLTIPKFIQTKKCDNRLKCVFHREIVGKIKQCTISQDRDGKYFVSILTEIDKELPAKPTPSRERAVGLDFGTVSFVTDSNGNKVDAPRLAKQSQDKLARYQQEYEALTKGSTAQISKREQITRLHAKIARQRKDFLDKLSHKLCHENQVDTICIEDLSISQMQETGWTGLNRSISDQGWFNFTKMLEYKSTWYGKNLIKIGRFDPSSKTCSDCGYVKRDMTMSVRQWICPKCGSSHDRDINAAKNILDFAFHKMGFPKGRDYPIEAYHLSG